MVTKFTELFLRNLKNPTSGQDNYIDKTPPLASVNGHLGLKVGKQKRTWYIRYRINSKRKSLKLGFYPAISLADAREEAVQLLTTVSNGTDPQLEKKAKVEAPTVSDLWTEYQKSLGRKKIKKSPTTLREETRKWHKEIEPAIGHHKVAEVTPAILAELLDKKADIAPVSANRLYSLLSLIFIPALRLGWITTHPLQWIEKPGGTEASRKRVLTDGEIHTLWPCFDQLRPNPRDLLKLGLLTAQRPGEIASMRWEDIDIAEKTWTQHNTKNGSTHLTPLARRAYEIIEARWEGQTSGWVFPSAYNRSRGAAEGRSICTKRARLKVQRESGTTGWTAHDLRRTARTIMSRLRIDQHIRERVLNHSQSGVVGVYDQYDYLDEKRDALNKLDRELRRILSV